MSLPEVLYEGLLASSRPGIRVATAFSARARQAVHGRQASQERFRSWSSAERAADRPLVWIHAPSVGEALMAKAIVAAIRAERPDVQVAFTHFSTSAERMVDEVGADVSGYVPFDTRRPVRRVLAALRPTTIAFVRTEVWPVLTREAAKAGASLVLVNAVLGEGSGRLRWLGRSFLEAAYRRLGAVGAVSEDHGERYELLGVPPGRIRVTGDARFDQVWDRIEARGLAELRGAGDAAERVPEELRPIWRVLYDPERFTLVAGSTWPADEERLLSAVRPAGESAGEPAGGRRMRLVIAPHEPTPGHLEALEARLEDASLSHVRLSRLLPTDGAPADGPAADPDAVVVDRLGILADLYALGDAAYVGGGFGTRGLHSVVEPAALGVPVLFGPAHGNAREAAALAESGGGFVVEDPAGLGERLRELSDDDLRRRTGEIARRFVRSRTGAAERNAALILERL